MAITYQAALLLENKADDESTIVTASSEIPDAPASLLLNPHIVRKWRSASEPASILVDHGSATDVDTVALIGVTASTFRVRISANADGSSPAYDSGTLSLDQRYKQLVCVLETAVNRRYVLIDLTHATLAYVEAGRVVDGVRNTFDFNYAPGFPVRYVDPSVTAETVGGQTIRDPRDSYRIMEPSFEFMSEADRDGFVDELAMIGVKSDVLFIAKPGGSTLARDTIWGANTAEPRISQPHDDVYSATLTIEERR